ncbi:MAG: hypothetical protein RIR26_1187 [Pseudomonadota bacterium]|jgi:cyclase
MLKKRIIPCLDIRNGRVTKGVSFLNNIDVGDPVALAQAYSQRGADEIVIYDIDASAESRPPDFSTIERIAAQSFVPICIGGGIAGFSDAARCIASGAEKVSLNSIAPKKPELISEISSHFGVQAVVLSLDVRRDASCPSGYRLFVRGGRTSTDWDMMQWLDFAVPRGVGEVCVNSIDEDGMKNGYDLDLLRILKSAIHVPLIVSGGAGHVSHVIEAFDKGADAALVASIVHSGETTVENLKKACLAAGLPMRMDW